MLKAARFNEDKTHRYFLSRIWDDKLSKVLFIGLNPSTADGLEDDHTVRRLISFARDWGFGGFYLVNTYSFKATEPKDLIAHIRTIPKDQLKKEYRDNLTFIKLYATVCPQIVYCWGTNIPEGNMANMMLDKLMRLTKGAYCFGLTKDGYPKHPLFLAGTTELIKFKSSLYS